MDPVASKLVTDLDGGKKLATYSPVQGRVVIQTVREEDEYMQHLETIVQRDYFPDLAAMHQNSNSLPVADASQRSISSTWSKSDSRNPERADPTAVSLDRYLANNTTEDDASFSELIEETERKRRIKLSSFFPSLEGPPVSTSAETKPLAITSGANVLIGPRPSVTGNSAVHFNPDGVPQTEEEYLDHLANDRRIVPSNTRFKRPFPPAVDKRSIAKQLVLHKLGRIGLDGKETESTLSTPQAAGFKFMDASPSPAPSVLGASPFMTWGELDATPSRLDDGSVNTPLVMSGAPAFRIPSPSQREQLAHKLADRASRQRLRDRHEAVKRVHSSVNSPSSRLLLSPAARRLLASSSSLGSQWTTSGGNSRPSTGSSTTSLSSPMHKVGTPRRHPLDLGVIRRPPTSSKLPSSSTVAPSRTDASDDTSVMTTSTAQSQSITDNLLNLRPGQLHFESSAES
ncbi:Sepiapterin reductase [Fasciolopsis buskii]|uniref:Sepiapterin reductase n=1 Tax=Fasciolopsis buskii TaxID=27845 RepID=A0A8E0RNL6_9TREM|nr:Sepiapterin reductase [Fasciolopsis buski]